MAKPYEEWPLILDATDIIECLDVSRSDAHAILKTGPVLDPDKRRDRRIARGPLWDYLSKRNLKDDQQNAKFEHDWRSHY